MTSPAPVTTSPEVPLTAMVVDDSALIRAQLKMLLGGAGFNVIAEAASADDLVGLYAKHRPDLVTLDIVMPGRDGAEAATELLTSFPDAKVVMCTSVSARDKIIRCKQAGVRHYLLKPFDTYHASAVLLAAVGRRMK